MKAILSVSLRLAVLVFIVFFIISVSLEQLNFFTKAYYKQKINRQVQEIVAKINLLKSIGDYGSNSEVDMDFENGWIEINNNTNMVVAHINSWKNEFESEANILNFLNLTNGKYSLGIHYGVDEVKNNVVYIS